MNAANISAMKYEELVALIKRALCEAVDGARGNMVSVRPVQIARILGIDDKIPPIFASMMSYILQNEFGGMRLANEGRQNVHYIFTREQITKLCNN